MKRTAEWIRHTHLFRRDEYECSSCGVKTERPKKACPGCGLPMRGEKYDPSWVDEIERMDMILEDD